MRPALSWRVAEVLEISGGQVCLGVAAPIGVKILRDELPEEDGEDFPWTSAAMRWPERVTNHAPGWGEEGEPASQSSDPEAPVNQSG